MQCRRCGLCCQMFNKDLWKGVDAVKRGEACEKLSFVDGLAICAIHDHKPEICKNGWGGKYTCPARKES